MKQTQGSVKKASVEKEINRYIVALLVLQLASCLGGTCCTSPYTCIVDGATRKIAR